MTLKLPVCLTTLLLASVTAYAAKPIANSIGMRFVRIEPGAFTMAEPCGYLSATQTRDGNIQLIASKNHYVFNLAWLKALPDVP